MLGLYRLKVTAQTAAGRSSMEAEPKFELDEQLRSDPDAFPNCIMYECFESLILVRLACGLGGPSGLCFAYPGYLRLATFLTLQHDSLREAAQALHLSDVSSLKPALLARWSKNTKHRSSFCGNNIMANAAHVTISLDPSDGNDFL